MLAGALSGCLAGRGRSATTPLTEADISAIGPSGAGCAAPPPATCPAAALCTTPVNVTVKLVTVDTTCGLPGLDLAEICALDLPLPNGVTNFQPTFRPGGVGEDELVVDTQSLLAAARPWGPVRVRTRLGAPEPAARCARPFELGWWQDLPDGVRRLVRLRGDLLPDGSVDPDTLVGDRRDESATFDCASTYGADAPTGGSTASSTGSVARPTCPP